ncbi:NAD(P)/FAD-dependent oxidoreductase [Phycisphaerales bacterium AB-hyl4]|uniref:NAD(P)/FAD-dependent oxidoreductase n=1 Tax=Natronomicrosphaera hydrolytica TaxID=3242702 RepID=A0ABV4U020_9BACT
MQTIRQRKVGLSAMQSEHVVIVGGGIVGLSAASFLKRKGARVTLLERDGFASSASTGNAGFIVLGHPPLPRPGLTSQALKMLFDPANPLYVPPRFDPALFRWLWQFRKACNEKQFHHSMEVLAEFGWIAGKAFDEIVNEAKLDCDYHRDGWLEIFETEKRFEHGRADADILKKHGYQFDELTGDEIRQQEPALRDNVVGAICYKDSGWADPGRCVAALAEHVKQQGVDIRVGAAVSRLVTSGDHAHGVELETGDMIEADQVVVAAGIWSQQLAQTVGLRVPMQAAKGYHINLAMPDVAPTRACLLAEAFVAVNPSCQGLRLAGTLEFSGINHNVVERRLNMLRINAARFLKGVDEAAELSTWCGLRPCTADGLPVIGRSPRIDNVIIATGHAMLGFGLGPGTGQLIAELVANEPPTMNLDAMSPARYA